MLSNEESTSSKLKTSKSSASHLFWYLINLDLFYTNHKETFDPFAYLNSKETIIGKVAHIILLLTKNFSFTF
jgi:hypothetical protein